MPETGFGSAADAAGQLEASLDYLAATDWVSLGTQAHGEMLARLQRAQAQLTAVNAAVLAAFTAQSGYEPDGHRSAMAWLVNRTKMSRGAAAGAIGWQRRLARHGVIAAAMATRKISESWGKDIATWTDPLPPLERDQADEILLEAAAAGVPLEDLRSLARSIWETWKAQHPDPDDGNGEPGDEDGFEDRRLRLGVTFGGAGKLTGDLAAGCAAKLQAIFDALGKHLGADDWRSVEQRQHDALDEALSRLIKSGLLPQSAGTDTLAQVIIPFPALRGMHGASPAEAEWMAGTAGQPGWLTGIGAEAAACDATIVPVVTGSVDWQAVDEMTQVWIGAHGLDRGREPCGCSCGGCTCSPPRRWTPRRRPGCGAPCWRWPPTRCPARPGWPPTCGPGCWAPRTTARACRWTWAAPATSRTTSAARSSCATSTAAGPAAATWAPPGATSTTSNRGRRAAKPASMT